MSKDAATQSVLKHRARLLAQRTRQEAARELFERIAVVEVGRERYGIVLSELREIVRATAVAPLPGLPSFMLGLSAVRGELFSVIDLAALRGLARGAASYFALIEVAGRALAITFDELAGVQDVYRDELAPELLSQGMIQGFTRAVTHEGLCILDATALLCSERVQVVHAHATVRRGSSV